MVACLQTQRSLLLRADRPTLRDALIVGPLGNSKHREARAMWTLRRNTLSRNGMETGGVLEALRDIGWAVVAAD